MRVTVDRLLYAEVADRPVHNWSPDMVGLLRYVRVRRAPTDRLRDMRGSHEGRIEIVLDRSPTARGDPQVRDLAREVLVVGPEGELDAIERIVNERPVVA